MIELTLSDLARYTEGRLCGASTAFNAVSTDTRSLPAGALFVALKGPNFDGHGFAMAALERGAAGALVEHELPINLPQVIVPDALHALSTFASAWRGSFSYPVIGITGSNGKTTTKEIIGSILSLRGSCLVTQGNLNNHIGVPLTLLRMETSHRTAVIEMGANHRGEIAALSAIAKPTIGIITNAGAAHLEGFGGLDGVAQGKGELLQALPASGVAVVNVDDQYASFWRERTSAKVVTFGLQASADFTARNVKSSDDKLGYDFELITPVGNRPARLSLVGEHNLRNALGAAAAAQAAGATLDEIVRGLADMRPVSGRLQVKPAMQGAFLIDDSYNANPSSMRAGLDALQQRPGKHWLVLGDMLELGPQADELHAQIGRYAREHDVERLWAIGSHTRFAVEAFGIGSAWFTDVNQLSDAVRTSLQPNITVLIKGSRANRLERVVAALSTNGSVENSH
jgi:UDP-N-acetylmuramoyl-tripeptide--D-alanyl-D-alanine ligase